MLKHPVYFPIVWDGVQGKPRETMMQVLGAAAWLVGEYCRPHLETLAKRMGQKVWFDTIQVTAICWPLR